jgi:hypothetical protein
MSKIDPQPIIDEYRAAYFKANGRELQYSLTYERGWFCFRSNSGFITGRHRARAMWEFIARLKARWPEHVHQEFAALAAKEGE